MRCSVGMFERRRSYRFVTSHLVGRATPVDCAFQQQRCVAAAASGGFFEVRWLRPEGNFRGRPRYGKSALRLILPPERRPSVHPSIRPSVEPVDKDSVQSCNLSSLHGYLKTNVDAQVAHVCVISMCHAVSGKLTVELASSFTIISSARVVLSTSCLIHDSF